LNLKRYTKQTAVYWARSSPAFDAYGKPLYEDPIEIDCRWEDVNELFVDSQGEQQTSSCKIMTLVDLVVGGFLMLGSLDSTLDLVTPSNNEGAWEIRSFSKTPDRKARKFVRTAYV